MCLLTRVRRAPGRTLEVPGHPEPEEGRAAVLQTQPRCRRGPSAGTPLRCHPWPGWPPAACAACAACAAGESCRRTPGSGCWAAPEVPSWSVPRVAVPSCLSDASRASPWALPAGRCDDAAESEAAAGGRRAAPGERKCWRLVLCFPASDNMATKPCSYLFFLA